MMSKEQNQEKDKKDSQRGIYLDTNILSPFSISLDHPLLQILLDVTEKWGFKIYIPEVVYLEWLQKKKENIEENFNEQVQKNPSTFLNNVRHIDNNC